MDREGLRTLTRGSDTNCLLRNSGIELTSCWMRRLQETSGNIRKPQVCWKITKTKTNQGTRMQSRNLILNYTSIDPKQQQRMFPPRSCAIQNSWNCLAHSYLLFYSFITSTVQIRGNKRNAPTHPGIHTEWRSLIFKRVQNWYKLFSLENNSASTSPWNRTLFLRKEEERRRETSTGTPARTKRNQEIHDETEPLSWKKERRRETSTGTQPEPGGTSKSWWNRSLFLRKERREKKGDKHRNPSRNQEEPANHDGTEPLSWGKKEERRRETSTGTKEERRGDKHRNPSRNQEEPANHDGTESRREKKGDKHRNQRREKKGDKHQNPSWNQEEPANHDGTEPLSGGKKEERRRETSTGTKEERRTETNTGIQPEPGGTSKSWWNRTPFLRKERRETVSPPCHPRPWGVENRPRRNNTANHPAANLKEPGTIFQTFW